MMSAGPHHHQVPMTQAQMNQAAEQQKAAIHNAKLRSARPTDKTLPDGVEQACVDDGQVAMAYKQLRDLERRLDATMTRKRLDIVDTVSRSAKRYKTLRIWITNTVEDQFWQTNGLNVDSFDFSSNLEASYRVKIEGRLLDDDDDEAEADKTEDPAPAAADDADKMDTDSPAKSKQQPKAIAAKAGQRHRFSHFFKALTVDFDRSKLAAGGRDASVEWKKPDRAPGAAGGSALPAMADFDEFTFKRNGEENTNITINLYRHEDPERFELSPELADVVDLREATRQEAVVGMWEYIKLMNLQEDEEKRNFRCDEVLRKVIDKDAGYIPLLNDYVTRHLKPLPPLSLPYTIRVDEAFHTQPGGPPPTVYDVRVAVDDPLRARLAPFVHPGTQHAATLRRVAEIDRDLGVIVQAIATHKAKHAFLKGMCEDPVGFVRAWLSSQKRDLEVIMGEATRGVGAGEGTAGDEWRRGGRESIWNSVNARESVNVLLAKQPVHR
ncbi:SWI/SNF and RSC complexes subunit ssr3 [Podospora conica]|nr:SWI/SNF and RSC complexes subunit ssr3 [Schizothecium conicum]